MKYWLSIGLIMLAACGRREFPIKVEVEKLPSFELESVSRAEQGVIELLRQHSGARSRLGMQADEVFQQIDQARSVTLQNLVRQRPRGKTALLPRTRQSKLLTSSAAILEAAFSITRTPIVLAADSGVWPGQNAAGIIAVVLMMAPDRLAGERRDGEGNLQLPAQEENTVQGGITVHSKIKPTFIGSRFEGQVEVTLATTKNGFRYEEMVSAVIRTNLCPDDRGEMPFELTVRSSVAGSQWGYKVQAVGHVDDEANFSTYDTQLKADAAIQPDSQGIAAGYNNMYLEFTNGLSMQGFNRSEHLTPQDITVSNYKFEVTRSSSKVTHEFSDEVISKMQHFADLPELYFMVFHRWKDGYCVAVSVPEIAGSQKFPTTIQKTVPVNSETPFTATVWHKFEKKELSVPVMATLKSGQISVAPNDVKVQAPGSFDYQASDMERETATVQLESRSKRGIGKLEVAFTTQGRPPEPKPKADWPVARDYTAQPRTRRLAEPPSPNSTDKTIEDAARVLRGLFR